MKKYFLVKVKYERLAEIGMIESVSEQYLIDAVSFTEAEARIISEIQPTLPNGCDFEVKGITPQKVDEIFFDENCEKWFKSKINFLFTDDKGKEKKTPIIIFVQANDINHSREKLVEQMKQSMADWEIASISDTKILEVFKYEPEN